MVHKLVQDPAPRQQALLLVDDSPSNLLAYKAVLEPLGREIVTATSGEEAVRLLAGRQFALLLIDVRMPGLDGFETVEMLRSELHRATPVVFVTGDRDDVAMQRAYDFGAVDYLVKPVHPGVLRGKVRNLVALYEQGVELEARAALLIEQQQRLAEADAEVRKQDTNIGIVAHDLRNPLGAVLSGAGILQKMVDLSPRARQIADRIDRSARRMTLMIRDILDFTRGRVGGGIPITRQLIDLEAACRSIADEVGAAHPTATIDVQVRGDLHGQWDQARVEQALSNLLTNAVQHGGGEVTLTASGEQPEEVSLAISNRGDAIPDQELPTLFEAFRKGDSSPGGLGLGLFIVREIAHAHDGRVEVTSSAGRTTFTIRLPRPNRSGSSANRPEMAREHPTSHLETPAPST